MNSEVWINGHHIGKRSNGYISFCYDLTACLNYGEKENVIAMKVISHWGSTHQATWNGDQTSHTSFQSHQRKAFHGKCIAIVKAGEEPDEIVVKASAEGLPDAVTRIQTK